MALAETAAAQTSVAHTFRVFVRGGRLMVAWPSHEANVHSLDGEEFRVGGERSADRLRFDTVVGVGAQHAYYNAVLYVRSFLD